MQKRPLHASILIWSVFLSLIISVSFLGISTSITRNLGKTEAITKQIQETQVIDALLKSETFEDTTLDSGDTLSFSSLTNQTFSLKQGESTEFHMENMSDISLDIEILHGGPIAYHFLRIAPDTPNAELTKSGTIDAAKSIVADVNSTYTTGILILKNLASYSTVTIASDAPVTPNTISYQIITDIGNTSTVKEYGNYKVFEIGGFNGLDYAQYGIYF